MDVEQLADRIEEDVVFGIHAAGSRLVEDRLVQRYEVTRHLLRASFAVLQARGIVARVPNRGVEVCEPTPDMIDDLYEVRHILETSAARATVLPVPTALISKLTALADEHEAACRREDFRGVFHANIALHALQFSACSNRALTDAIADYARRVHLIRAIKYDDPRHMANVVAQHRAIVAAMAGHDPDAYEACVAAHLPASSLAYRKHYERRHGLHERMRKTA